MSNWWSRCWDTWPNTDSTKSQAGAAGHPAEVVLRILVFKRIKGWSFEQTERERGYL